MAWVAGCHLGCGSDSGSGSLEPDAQAPPQPGGGGAAEPASSGGASGDAGVGGTAGSIDRCAAGGASGDDTLTDCGGVCANLDSDPSHCGACDHACQPGEQCVLGLCECASGLSCSGTCVPLDDDGNCGACGVACPTSQRCVAGSCQCTEAGLTLCAASCVDLTSSAEHCGGCDAACPPGTHCSSSQCTCDDSSLQLCNSVCVDAETYAQQCGECAGECSGRMQCINSACRCPDPIVAAPVRLTDSPSDSSRPRAAWNGTHVAVAYFDGEESDSSQMGRHGNVYVALLNPDATRAIAQDIPLTTFDFAGTERTGFVEYPPDIVWTGSEFGVVWTQVDTTDSSASVCQLAFQRMAPDGSLLGTQVILASDGRDLFAFPELSWNPVYGGYGVLSLNDSNGDFELRLIGADGTTSEAPLAIPAPMVMPSVPEDGIPVLSVAPTGEWGVLQDIYIFVHLTVVSADGTQYGEPVDLAAPGFGEGAPADRRAGGSLGFQENCELNL